MVTMMAAVRVCCQIKAECVGCRQRAAIFNMSYFGKFYLTGPDAQAAADYIFTNDVDLRPGQQQHVQTMIVSTVRQLL